MPASLLLDLLVAILLVVTIGYTIALNRRLKGLREHRAELDALAASFAQATTKAEESVARLKSSVAELQAASERAQSLRDDLAFLVERGGTAADKLEDLVRAARGATSPGAAAAGSDELRAAAPKAKPAAATEPVVPGKPSGFKEPTLSSKPAGDKKAPSDPADELLKALRSAR